MLRQKNIVTELVNYVIMESEIQVAYLMFWFKLCCIASIC